MNQCYRGEDVHREETCRSLPTVGRKNATLQAVHRKYMSLHYALSAKDSGQYGVLLVGCRPKLLLIGSAEAQA